MGSCLPRGSCMVGIFRNVSQRRSLKKEFRMHCYAFCNVVSQRQSLKKEFRMHCYAFEMYLKDGPLRRSSECIAMNLKCISKTVP